jgi:tetratricopeptide (TPR) repeat protein
MREESKKIVNISSPLSPRWNSVWTESIDRVVDATALLVDYSLLDYDATNSFYSLHPVVHEWARARLQEDDQRSWLEATMAVLADCISPNLKASQAEFRKQLLPHINACLGLYRNNFADLPIPSKLEHCVAMEKFASVLAENGLWKQARGLQSRVLEYRRRNLGNYHEDTIIAQQYLGEILWNLFDIKAAIDIQVTVMKRRWLMRPSISWWFPPWTWKPEHVSYCMALSDLTRSLWLAGRRDLSQRAGERAVTGLTKYLGREDPRTLTAMFNLARAYLHLGSLEQSHDLLRWVVDKREHFFGPRHLDTLMAKNEFGMVLCEQGQDLDLAESTVIEVLNARTEILGEEHAYTLWAVNDYSKILCARGRFDEAAQLLQDAEPVVIRTLGERHVGLAMTRGNLARAYARCEKWAKAEEVLMSLEEIMPKEHPELPATIIGLAKVRIRTERLQEAEADAKRVLEMLSSGKQSSELQIQEAVELLLKIYKMEKRQDDAERLLSQHKALAMRIQSSQSAPVWPN